MRDILFKDRTSVSARKKDVLLKEVFEKDGVVAKTERRCFYFVKDIRHLDAAEDLQKWVDSQKKTDSLTKRHFCILKGHDDKTGQDRLICKIAGTFYVIVDKNVYTVAFLHAFKVCFTKNSAEK